jgi:peroxiredoxin
MFDALGVRIVAVSFGGPERTKPWVEEEKFPFEVWTDTDRTLAHALGAGDGAMPARVTALIDAQGKVVLTYPEVDVTSGPEDVLDDAAVVFAAPAH